MFLGVHQKKASLYNHTGMLKTHLIFVSFLLLADVLCGLFLYYSVFRSLILKSLLFNFTDIKPIIMPFKSFDFIYFFHFDVLILKSVISISCNFLISVYTCLCIMFSVF